MNDTVNTITTVFPFKIMQRVSKVMLFIIKTHSEVFRSDVWKEIGGIDSTIELLVTELKRINKEAH